MKYPLRLMEDLYIVIKRILSYQPVFHIGLVVVGLGHALSFLKVGCEGDNLLTSCQMKGSSANSKSCDIFQYPVESNSDKIWGLFV